MRRSSCFHCQARFDGPLSPTKTQKNRTPSSQIGSYFNLRRARTSIHDDSTNPSPFFDTVSKRNHSKTEEPEPASPTQPNVQDWNVTRLFDSRNADSTQSTPVQQYPRLAVPSETNSDWNVSRKYDVKAVPTQPIDPPRPAREGCEWVWFPGGYWAEREREVPVFLSPHDQLKRRKSSKFNTGNWFKPPDRKSNDSEDSWQSTSPRSSRRFFGSFSSKQNSGNSFNGSQKSGSGVSSRSARLLERIHSLSPTYPRYVSPTGELEGLYCKTKRSLAVPFSRRRKRARHNTEQQSARPSRSHSSTAVMLEGVTHYFDRSQAEKSAEKAIQTPASSNGSIETKRRFKFGLAPWRRFSDNSLLSASSSIHELMMGKTPLGTPKSEARYLGAQGKSFVKVEISEANAPNYLPSEARRIHTPPRTPPVASTGMFFSGPSFPASPHSTVSTKRNSTESRAPAQNTLQVFAAGATSPNNKSSELRPPPSGSRQSSRGALSRFVSGESSRKPSSDSNRSTSRSKATSFGETHPNTSIPIHAPPERSRFSISIPDHLPNSPLCPANPLHGGRGKGICPLHGRKKSSKLGDVAGIEIRISTEDD